VDESDWLDEERLDALDYGDFKEELLKRSHHLGLQGQPVVEADRLDESVEMIAREEPEPPDVGRL